MKTTLRLTLTAAGVSTFGGAVWADYDETSGALAGTVICIAPAVRPAEMRT
jgi:hypothetical protein